MMRRAQWFLMSLPMIFQTGRNGLAALFPLGVRLPLGVGERDKEIVIYTSRVRPERFSMYQKAKNRLRSGRI